MLRGIIIAAMILVNNPGNGETSYWPLKHADWNGWTPTDLIFPSFIFMMGVAMTLSFPARLVRGATVPSLVRHIILRSVALFAIGFVFVNGFPDFLSEFPNFDVHTWRIPGVLQRFAAGYLVVGLLYLFTYRKEPIRANIPVVIAAAIFCLVAYWALLTFVPVPGYGAGNLSREGNLGAYIDRAVFGSHLYGSTKTWDPEGLLSTLPSLATVLLGILAGEWLRSGHPAARKSAVFIGAGIALVTIGVLLHPSFPINKKLWTSTFVLFTGGFITICLGICYWALDIRRWQRFIMPALVFGTNSILVYTLSEVLNPIADKAGAREWIYNHLRVSSLNPYNASLAYALLYVFINFLIIFPLYRKRIFIRL